MTQGEVAHSAEHWTRDKSAQHKKNYLRTKIDCEYICNNTDEYNFYRYGMGYYVKTSQILCFNVNNV